jgi:hypothetical protein
MVYESLLALAVLFLPFLVFELIVQGAHTPLTEHLRQCLAFSSWARISSTSGTAKDKPWP